MTKKTLILAVVLFVVGVVVGVFATSAIMKRSENKAVTAAVGAEKERSEAVLRERDMLAQRMKLMEFHLRLGHVTIQASQMNYGLARSEAALLFDDLAKFAEENKGSRHLPGVEAILAKRDQVLNDLAVGSPAATVALRSLYLEPIQQAGK